VKERKPNRLRDYDYSQNGYYFVTICTQGRNDWFGEIIDGEMNLNPFGEIANRSWAELPLHFGFVKGDEFRVMPNHVHGIVVIENESVGTGRRCYSPKPSNSINQR
jgi:putative transposase